MKEQTIRWGPLAFSSQENHPPICYNQKRVEWTDRRGDQQISSTWIFLSGVLVMDDVWGAGKKTPWDPQGSNKQQPELEDAGYIEMN